MMIDTNMSIIYTILREDYKNDVNVPNVPKFSYPPLFLKTLKADFKISSSSYQLMLSHPPPPNFPFRKVQAKNLSIFALNWHAFLWCS